jgi:hypothetical protein
MWPDRRVRTRKLDAEQEGGQVMSSPGDATSSYCRVKPRKLTSLPGPQFPQPETVTQMAKMCIEVPLHMSRCPEVITVQVGEGVSSSAKHHGKAREELSLGSSLSHLRLHRRGSMAASCPGTHP